MPSTPGFFNFSREPIFAALFEIGWAAMAWQNSKASARRVKLFSDVPTEQRPAFFQFEGHEETYDWSSNAQSPKVILQASWFIYTSAPEPIIGSTLLNEALDALATALIPRGSDVVNAGRLTLGGLVHSARIQGSVTRVPGDLDSDGMAIVPVRILVNA
jgi:hypothetical protein